MAAISPDEANTDTLLVFRPWRLLTVPSPSPELLFFRAWLIAMIASLDEAATPTLLFLRPAVLLLLLVASTDATQALLFLRPKLTTMGVSCSPSLASSVSSDELLATATAPAGVATSLPDAAATAAARGDAARGDVERGETDRGDVVCGDTTRGEPVRGDVALLLPSLRLPSVPLLLPSLRRLKNPKGESSPAAPTRCQAIPPRSCTQNRPRDTHTDTHFRTSAAARQHRRLA